MLNRLRWILVSYVRRPLILGLAALGTFTFALSYLVSAVPQSSYRTANYPSPPRVNLFVRSLDVLEEVRRQGLQTEVDGLDLGALWMEMSKKDERWDDALQRKVLMHEPPNDALYAVVDEFPNLRSLMTFYGWPCDARCFAKLSKLEYLMLRGTEVTHLESLAALTHLKRLDWDVIQPPVDFDSLSALPKLEMIAFTSRLAVGDALLETVARFPHLKVLVLGFSDMSLPPNWPPDKKFDSGVPPITEAGMDAVAAAPRLNALYVGGYLPRAQDTLLNMALAQSHLSVYPAAVERQRLPGGKALSLVPCLIFALAIGLQLADQFRGPMCRLAPNFKWSHAAVGVVLCALIVALTAFRLVDLGAGILSTVVLALLMMAAVIAIAAAAGGGEIQRHRRLAWIIPVSVGIVILSAFSSNPQDWLLRKENPAALTLLFLAAFTAVGLACWTLNRLVEWRSSSTSVHRANWIKNAGVTGQIRESWALGMRGGEARIDRLKSGSAKQHFWWRIQRLRAGNPPVRTIAFALVMTISMLIWQGLVQGFWNFGNESSFIISAIRTTSFMILAITAGQVAVAWRMRTALLSMEVTRPCSRLTLQKELATAFLIDLIPLAAFAAILQTVAANVSPDLSLRWRSVPFDFAAWFVTDVSVVVGIGAMMVVTHRLWLAITLAIGAAYIGIFATLVLTLMRVGPSGLRLTWSMGSPLESQLWLPILAGIALTCFMARRWFRMEIGARQ